MARPPKYDADSMLDAALALFAEGGVRAVTASGVARRLGAPSGSVYHRFDSSAALTAALWNRTVARFQRGLLQSLEAGDPVVAARQALRWCAEHQAEARLLLAGRRAVAPGEWSAAAIAAREADQARLMGALEDLSVRTGIPLTRIVFALVDVPYAAVRRDLTHPDPAWEQLAVETVTALLAAE